MIFMDIDEILVAKTYKMVLLTIWIIPLQSLNQIIQTYVISQDVTTPFTIMNILSILICIYFGKKFIIDDDYREIGFCYTRIVQEFVNVIYSFIVMLIYANKETLIRPTWKMIKNKLVYYSCYTLTTSMSFYGESFSFELTVYFSALLHNTNEMASFIAIINALFYVIFISFGLMNTFRTCIGLSLGKGQITKARKDSIIYIISMGFLSLLLITFLYIYSFSIAQIFIGHNEDTLVVEKGIKTYCISIFPSFVLYSLSSMMRFLNKNDIAVKSTAILMPILVFVFAGFFAFYLNMGANGLVWGICFSKIIVMFIFFHCIYNADWESCYKSFEINNKNTENDLSHKLME